MGDVTYEQQRQEVALLERLTAEARLKLVRDGNQIVAPSMKASAEGVLISEVLGIFLFLFLLLGMVGFFHKETNCATQACQRLRKRLGRVLRGLRRLICRSHREWSGEEGASSVDTSQTGVYRDISSSDDVTGAVEKPPEAPFDHRAAILEVFADLELHREVVHDSLRGYNAALSRLNGPQSGQGRLNGSESGQELRGILRPNSAAPVHGKHRHGHHGHRHRPRPALTICDGTAETDLNGDVIIDRDVTAENGGGVTAKSEQNGVQKTGQDTQSDCKAILNSDRDAQTNCDATTKVVWEDVVEADDKTEAIHDVTKVANVDIRTEAVGDVSAEAHRGVTKNAERSDSPETNRDQQPESDAIPEITFTFSDVTAKYEQDTQTTCEVSYETITGPTQTDSDAAVSEATGMEPLKEGPTLVKNGVLLQDDDDITSGQNGGSTGPIFVRPDGGDSTSNGDTSSQPGDDVMPQRGDVTLEQNGALSVCGHGRAALLK